MNRKFLIKKSMKQGSLKKNLNSFKMRKTLLILIFAFLGIVNSTKAQDTIASGNCGASGNNLTWVLIDDGTLTISGSGAMADYYANWDDEYYYYNTNIPWYSYRNIISTVIINYGVTKIGNYAFMGSTFLTSVSVPNSVISIGFNVFLNCSGLISIDEDSNNVAYASENGVLFNKLKTTLIEYPVGKVDTSYTIPDGVTTINSCTFTACSHLTSVTFPSSITYIGFAAFQNCYNLTSMTCHATTPPVAEFSTCNTPMDIIIYIPCGTSNNYRYAWGWCHFSNFVDILPLPKPTITQNGNVLTSNEAYSYQWYLNNSPISGATAQTYTCTQNGVYFVEVSNEEDCSAKSDEITISDVGIVETPEMVSPQIYPNPAFTQLHVKLDTQEATDYSIYSITGQTILQGKLQDEVSTINIESLASGMYYLKIANKTVKFVKE